MTGSRRGSGRVGSGPLALVIPESAEHHLEIAHMGGGVLESDRRRVRELSREESLGLLGSVPWGRVVFTDRALPAIRPVNHLLDGGQVIIRSHTGAAILSAAERGVVVAYEADAIDAEFRLGWSVVVTGVARPVEDRALVADYQRRLRPWIDHPLDRVIAISADVVTGFALSGAATAGGVEREP
jgi:pyridoxamine 5'-phosphate oxidase-like protein